MMKRSARAHSGPETAFLFASAPPADSSEQRGPMAPPSPPPPYTFTRFSSHVYQMIDPQPGQQWMCRIALFQFLIGALSISTALSCILRYDNACPYYTGVWVSIVCLINSILGIVAARRATVNCLVAHLVSSVLATVACVILMGMSIRNWTEAGYKTGELCIFTKHDTVHLQKNIWNNYNYHYGQCVYDLKLGLTFNVILMVCAVLEGEAPLLPR